LRTAYSALSPPLRKLNRNFALSSPVPSGMGVSERDGTAAAWGNAVPHTSHSASAGWFRKVHAGHAISFCASTGPVAVKNEEEENSCAEAEEGGAEAARGGVGAAESALGRGTPQRPHLAPVGLEPGGLR
jgi:hypothetical protein